MTQVPGYPKTEYCKAISVTHLLHVTRYGALLSIALGHFPRDTEQEWGNILELDIKDTRTIHDNMMPRVVIYDQPLILQTDHAHV